MSVTTTMSVSMTTTMSMTVTITVSMAMTAGCLFKTLSLYLDGNVVDTVFFDLISGLLQDGLRVMIGNHLANENVLASAETPTVELL